MKYIKTIFLPLCEEEDGIGINKKLLQRIKKIGNIDSTVNSVIEDILNHCDRCDQFVENRN